jgi:hypothetical protein
VLLVNQPSWVAYHYTGVHGVGTRLAFLKYPSSAAGGRQFSRIHQWHGKKKYPCHRADNVMMKKDGWIVQAHTILIRRECDTRSTCTCTRPDRAVSPCRRDPLSPPATARGDLFAVRLDRRRRAMFKSRQSRLQTGKK